MGSQEVLERVGRDEDGGVGFDQVVDFRKEIEHLDVDILDDLDSYLEDIDDRLTISRMVGDAVIKGMVNAFQQEASEEIAAKEFEVARLKESFCTRGVGSDEIGSFQSLVIGNETGNLELDEFLNFKDVCVKHDKMRVSLHTLKKDAKEQFLALKKEIGGIRGSCTLRRAGSGSGFVGLGGILKEHETVSWGELDRKVDSLEKTMNSMCKSVENMLQLSKVSICKWTQEQEFKRELEEMVMKSSIRSQYEEFETRMWDQKAYLYDNQTVNWLEKVNEISGLRKELDALIKLLPTPPDHGQLVSQGSIDLDNSHDSTGVEGNGKVDGSKTSVAENFNAAQLLHMKREDLVSYFNNEILKLKREHESKVQEITERYFLKGKYSNERGSVLPLTKGKESDVLRKKIPEVIAKLDAMLVDSEKLPARGDNVDSLSSLRARLDTLLTENHQLRDSLAEKKHELKCLSLQVSDASERMLRYSSVEANLKKVIRNLRSSLEDAHIESAITRDVDTCVLGELRDQIICSNEESELRLCLVQDIYTAKLREATIDVKSTSKYDIEDAEIESSFNQELYGSILVERLKDGKQKFEELSERYLLVDQNQVSLEMKGKEREARLRSEVEENERLRQELALLSETVEEKERLAVEVSTALTKEKLRVEQVSEELNGLKEHASLQQTLVSKANKDIDALNGELVEAGEQIEVYQMEIRSLNQKIEGLMDELMKVGVHRNMVLALTQEKADCLSLLETKEKEHLEQIKVIIPLVKGLSENIANFTSQVTGDMKRNDLRLENASSQLRSVIKKGNILRQKEFQYKQMLERRCADLQMAEAEVDLLGDEVETLLNLLEKIYVALDHYSPVLQHYPGIIEILKLVRRELSVESVKPV